METLPETYMSMYVLHALKHDIIPSIALGCALAQ